MKLLQNFAVGLTFAFVLFAAPSAHAAGTPGFECVPTNEANDCLTADTFLKCVSDGATVPKFTCQCDATTSLWEVLTTKCVFKAAGTCTPGGAPLQQCPKFSACTGAAGLETCVCQAESTAVAGLCRANFGTTCTETQTTAPACDASTFAKCTSDGAATPKWTCQCDATTSVFEDVTKKCVFKAAGTCTPGAAPLQQCPKFSACTGAAGSETCVCQAESTAINNKCIANQDKACSVDGVAKPPCNGATFAVCLGDAATAKCSCSATSIWEDAKCAIKANATCDTTIGTEGCHKFSTCADAGDGPKCNCDLFDSTPVDGKCLALLGKPCKTDDSAPNCDTSSLLECDAALAVCKCKAGNEGTDKCIAKLGENCPGPNADCDAANSQSCGDDHKCGCIRDHVADSTQKCVLMAGKACDPANNKCEALAECGKDNKCTCKTGMSDNGQGLCRAMAGAACDAATAPCDALATCTEKVCACSKGTANNGKGLCRVPVGGTCDAAALPCDAPLATCTGTTDKKCLCAETPAGLIDNGKGLCRVVKLDGACSAAAPCDESRYFACSAATAGKCACATNHTAGKPGACHANLGDVCDADARVCDDAKQIWCSKDNVCACKEGLTATEGVCNGALKLGSTFTLMATLVLVVMSFFKS
jgi:hypothetical protein